MVVSSNPRVKISISLIKYMQNKCNCKYVIIMRYTQKRDNTAASFCVCACLCVCVCACTCACGCMRERERGGG